MGNTGNLMVRGRKKLSWAIKGRVFPQTRVKSLCGCTAYSGASSPTLKAPVRSSAKVTWPLAGSPAKERAPLPALSFMRYLLTWCLRRKRKGPCPLPQTSRAS